MKMADYLGRDVSRLLEAEPFKHWPVEYFVDDDADPPVAGYIFLGCGLQINCDRGDERVRSLFLEKEEHDGEVLSELPFKQDRARVLARMGTPSKSGAGFSNPILGDFGPWDRFRRSDFTVHVQYTTDSEAIEKITLMRNDVVP